MQPSLYKALDAALWLAATTLNRQDVIEWLQDLQFKENHDFSTMNGGAHEYTFHLEKDLGLIWKALMNPQMIICNGAESEVCPVNDFHLIES